MKLLVTPITRTSLDRVEVLKLEKQTDSAGAKKIIVILGYGYDDSGSDKVVRYDEHEFVGQDCIDIDASADPDSTVLSKLSISVQ